MTLAIMVHGGAHAIPPEEEQAHKDGCLRALQAGWTVLKSGGRALDAVEAAVRVLEDDPTFNAGFGSELNAEGQAEMDASIMDGATLNAGGIGAVKGARHPISIARSVLESEFVLLVGDGAERFAAQHGAELCHPEEMISEKQRRKWADKQCEKAGAKSADVSDTVGCVALDAEGNLAAGTSTGGTGSNPPGRLGDTPVIGSGLFADGLLGACSVTGEGEYISRVVLSKAAVDLLATGLSPDEAAERAIRMMEDRVGGEAGCILIDREGRTGWAHNASNIACAFFTSEMDAPVAYVKKEEAS